jgi:hypothetical protein
MERTALLEPPLQEQLPITLTPAGLDGEIVTLEQQFGPNLPDTAVSTQITYNHIPRHAAPEIKWGERFRSSRLGRAVIGLATTVGLAGGGVALAASPAAADSGTVHHVYNTGGEGLWLHPNSPQRHGALSDLMADGQEFDVSCWKHGDNVEGDSIWLHGTNTATGNTGDAADFYIDTDVTQGNEAQQLTEQGIYECGTEKQQTDSNLENLQPAETLQGTRANPEQTNIYNGQRAANWAYEHGMDQPPSDGSCTWFASNALWQGGLVKTPEWTSEGHLTSKAERLRHFTSKNPDYNLPGTSAAWNVVAFKNYLQKTYPNATWEPIDFSPANRDPQDAAPGDLVFYDWGEGENISHVAVVTHVDPSGYMEVADWSTYDKDGTIPSPDHDRGVTYSDVRGEWLQVKHPNVAAFLMHMDTTGSPGNP